MSKIKYSACCRIAAVVLFASAGFAQNESQFRVRPQPGWDPRAREGRCDVRIWVDHLAELRIRGDVISVRTVEGARSYDEGRPVQPAASL
jgi:hypothetical protein